MPGKKNKKAAVIEAGAGEAPAKPAGKKNNIVVYKTLIAGTRVKISPGHYIPAKDSTISTSDPEEIKFLADRRKEEQDLPVRMKSILTEDEFYSVKSPEKLYITYNGKALHITEVREGLDIAVENGWVPEYRDIDHAVDTKSRVKKSDSGITAGSISA